MSKIHVTVSILDFKYLIVVYDDTYYLFISVEKNFDYNP